MALVFSVEDFTRVVMHLSWKCLGLSLEGYSLGLGLGLVSLVSVSCLDLGPGLRWHCLVNITGTFRLKYGQTAWKPGYFKTKYEMR